MNFLARWLLINFIRNRFAGRRQPLARRSPYRGGGRYPTTFGRPRGRTQVRVGGCCLPIPLGVVALGALSARLFHSGR